MAKKWFVDPEAVRVELPEGEWLLLKKRLTEGERRKSIAMTVSEVRKDGRITPNFEMVGKANVLSYLVDWSLCDNSGKPVRIDDDAKKEAALNNLAPDAFEVIERAIEAHVAAMDAARDAEKNDRAGETNSSAISPSAA